MNEFAYHVAQFLVCCFAGIVLFVVGAAWRDRRAARMEKDLKSRIEAQKILMSGYRQEIAAKAFEIAGSRGLSKWMERDLEAISEATNLYRHRLLESGSGTLEKEFNRGVIHGLNAAVLQLRGWL